MRRVVSAAGGDVVGEIQPLATLQPVVHPSLDVVTCSSDGDRGLVSGRHVPGSRFQLLQGPVDRIALARSGDLTQGTQRQHQCQRFIG